MVVSPIVLYIGGWGRSGSTILGRILDQHARFCFVGELPEIWKIGLRDNRYCACGKRFKECKFWSAVLECAFGRIDNIDAEMMIYYREHGTRNRYVPNLLFSSSRTRLYKRLFPYFENLKRLYAAIAEVSNCDVIVDSSKWPMYGRILDDILPFEFYMIHLIRDARAVAYSWQRRQLQQPGTDDPLPRAPYSILRSTYQWLFANLTTEFFWSRNEERYLRIYYEKFINNPQQIITDILSLIEKESNDFLLLNGHTVRLEHSHALAGNPVKFNVGDVFLQIDNEWLHKMSRLNRNFVTVLTCPLLKKYGYFP